MVALYLKSPAFEDGAEIPRRHGYKNGNASPPLEFGGIPEGCRSLALVMDDPDAVGAVGKVWLHWTVWNVGPDRTRFDDSSAPPGSAQGVTDFDSAGYGGPAPPDRRHTYVFTLYALDRALDVPAGAGRREVEDAMVGHVVEKAVLTGTYAP